MKHVLTQYGAYISHLAAMFEDSLFKPAYRAHV